MQFVKVFRKIPDKVKHDINQFFGRKFEVLSHPIWKFDFGAAADLAAQNVQHSRYLENWYLEAGRHLETSDADTEVVVL